MLESTMICNCGTEGRFVEFQTFSYWFCPECKDEIKAQLNENAQMGKVGVDVKLTERSDEPEGWAEFQKMWEELAKDETVKWVRCTTPNNAFRTDDNLVDIKRWYREGYRLKLPIETASCFSDAYHARWRNYEKI